MVQMMSRFKRNNMSSKVHTNNGTYQTDNYLNLIKKYQQSVCLPHCGY